MKKVVPIFFLLALMLTATSVAFAQGGNPPVPSPPSGSAVLDTLDWLTPAQEDEINAVTIALDEEGLAQIAVVTLDDCGADKQKFRNDLFREWGIGHADDNDGLLILVCWQGGIKGQRSLEQEVGYGLEAIVPDLLTSQVAEKYYVPFLKSGNEAGATLVAMVNAYDKIIREDAQGASQQNQAADSENSGSATLLIVLLVILIIFVVFALSVGVTAGDFTSGGYYSGSWSGGSSNSGASSGGGGFGGFGGGSSGGGGSSTGG